MIVPLSGGRTATLRDRLKYEQGRAVRAAILAVDKDPAALIDLDMALVHAYLQAWDVLDDSGDPIPIGEPEKAYDDVIQDVANAAMRIWKGRVSPKGRGRAPSPITPQALRSA